jgi:hypothetical protein
MADSETQIAVQANDVIARLRASKAQETEKAQVSAKRQAEIRSTMEQLDAKMAEAINSRDVKAADEVTREIQAARKNFQEASHDIAALTVAYGQKLNELGIQITSARDATPTELAQKAKAEIWVEEASAALVAAEKGLADANSLKGMGAMFGRKTAAIENATQAVETAKANLLTAESAVESTRLQIVQAGEARIANMSLSETAQEHAQMNSQIVTLLNTSLGELRTSFEDIRGVVTLRNTQRTTYAADIAQKTFDLIALVSAADAARTLVNDPLLSAKEQAAAKTDLEFAESEHSRIEAELRTDKEMAAKIESDIVQQKIHTTAVNEAIQITEGLVRNYKLEAEKATQNYQALLRIEQGVNRIDAATQFAEIQAEAEMRTVDTMADFTTSGRQARLDLARKTPELIAHHEGVLDKLAAHSKAMDAEHAKLDAQNLEIARRIIAKHEGSTKAA